MKGPHPIREVLALAMLDHVRGDSAWADDALQRLAREVADLVAEARALPQASDAPPPQARAPAPPRPWSVPWARLQRATRADDDGSVDVPKLEPSS